jgi:hypothetical protein
MEPHRRSIAYRLIWAGVGLLTATIVGRVVWVIEASRQEQQRREMALTLQRRGTELYFGWLMVEARRQRVEHAARQLHPGGSWLCERVPCTDYPLLRPEDTPRLLRIPLLVGDGPLPPERR